MPKRRNPFDDTHFLLKMHIGVKEVNLGVNHVENMKKVYENTMKMLLSGSAENRTKMIKVKNGMSAFENVVPKVLNGMPLVHKESPVNGNGLFYKMEENKNRKVNIMNPCCTSNLQILCSFCERIICIACKRVCLNCNNTFCQLCSILQYDSQEETAVCLSCM